MLGCLGLILSCVVSVALGLGIIIFAKIALSWIQFRGMTGRWPSTNEDEVAMRLVHIVRRVENAKSQQEKDDIVSWNIHRAMKEDNLFLARAIHTHFILLGEPPTRSFNPGS